MLRSYVCNQCRLRISQRMASPKRPQWQPKATFVSLRSAKRQPDSSAQNSLENGNKDDTVENNEGHMASRIRYTSHDERPRLGRYSRRVQGIDDTLVGQEEPYLEDMSSSSTKNQGVYTRLASSPAEMIANCLAFNNVTDAWELFLEHYPSRDCPALTNPDFKDVEHLNGARIFSRLSDANMTHFCNGWGSPVTPTALFFKYEQLGISRPEMWRNTFGYVTDQLLWAISGTQRKKLGAELVLSELLSLWRLFLQCKGPKKDPLESISTEWKSIPELRSLSGLHTENYFGSRLQLCHPQTTCTPTIQFSAVSIFNVFDEVNQETFKVPDSLREQSKPFIQHLTYILAGSDVESALKRTEYSPSFRALPEEFRTAFLDQISSAPSHAMKLIGLQFNEQQGGAGIDARDFNDAERASNLEEFYLKRIGRTVVSKSHAGQLESIWKGVVRAYASADQKTAIPPSIYHAFLSGFMALYQSDQTVKVWNHMVTNGVKPDIRTWNAMLDGCTKARDLIGLNSVWDRMIKSGIEPDNHAWTTRVYGLVRLHQIKLAFSALDDMGKKWLSAENNLKNPSKREGGSNKLPTTRKTINKFPKPSIEVVNAAASAIVQMKPRDLSFQRKVEFLQKVLQWSANFGVKPDTRTYNILLHLYLEANDSHTAFKILRQMESEGIEGDLATHTMLIRAAFENQKFNDLTESQQAERILAIFSELEASGLKLNDYVYASTIDRLLKYYGNYTAVRTVIDHMMSRGMVPVSRIYTSLVTHYFQQSPPDIRAVDSLILQISRPPRAHTDKIFFDRVIEGYAVNGEVGAMMSVLARMSSHGKLPGWKALTVAVRALAEAGDWERARLIVRDVQMGEGVAKGGVTGGLRGQKEFFASIYSLDGGRLMQTLAGDYLQEIPRSIGEQEQRGALEGLEELIRPEAQELYARSEAEVEPEVEKFEFVNAEHASYLSDEGEPEPRWRLGGAGPVGNAPL